MSRKISTRLTVGVAAVSVAGLVAGGLLLGAGASSASVHTLTQTYTCPFPLIGDQPIKVVISSEIPDSVPVGQPTGQINIKAVATVPPEATSGLNLVGGKTLEGAAVSSDEVDMPDGMKVPVETPVTIAPVPIPAEGSFELIALGKTVSLKPPTAGELKIFVNGLFLKQITPKKADGSLTGLGAFDSQCTLPDSEPRQLATVTVTGGPATSTTTPPVTSTTTAPPVTSTTTPPVTSTTAPPVTTTTAPPVTTTTSNPGPGVVFNYNLTGVSKLVNFGGTLPLTGGFDAVANVSAKTYVGDLTLNRTSSQGFTLFGFMPLNVDVAFQQIDKFTGTLPPAGLTVDGTLQIKLPKMALYGIPIATADCQVAQPTKITLVNSGAFDPFTGGKLVGKYNLSGAKNCGGLNDWIAPFVTSTGNTIEVNLTKK